METLNVQKFKRNPTAIKKHFKKVGTSVILNEDIRVIFPERYVNQKLAYLGSDVDIINIFAIVDNNNNYAVSLAPIFIKLTPHNISNVTIDGVINKVLEFNKGDIYTPNTILEKNADFLYNIFDEFFIKGKIPWFLDYDDVSDMLLTTAKYADSGIGNNPVTMEILAAVISRDNSKKQVFYRQSIKSKKDNIDIAYIGLNDIYYSFDNTASKLVGGYFGAGVTAAIVNKEKRTTAVADVLRK